MSSEIEAVIAAEHARHQALLDRDFAVLDRLFADDLTVTHTRGLSQNKAELLHYINTELEFLEVSRGPLNVRLLGDVAIMTGEMMNKVRGRSRGDIVEVRSMTIQVWHREGTEWRLKALQATALPSGPPPA